MLAAIKPGSQVVMVGAGFISFTILNSILSLGAKLTVVELAPRILPRMVDATGAELVEGWLRQHGVTVRTGREARPKIEDAKGRKRLRFAAGADLVADVVIMATGIRTNLDWLKDSGVDVEPGHRRRRPPALQRANVYAAGDVAEGRDLISGAAPPCTPSSPPRRSTAAWPAPTWPARTCATAALCIINIVEVCHLDVASFGAWDDAQGGGRSAG